MSEDVEQWTNFVLHEQTFASRFFPLESWQQNESTNSLGEVHDLTDQCNGIVGSRTIVNDGEPVEAIFFRDKIKYFFRPVIFEALVGYLGSYWNYPLKPFLVK